MSIELACGHSVQRSTYHPEPSYPCWRCKSRSEVVLRWYDTGRPEVQAARIDREPQRPK